MLVAVNLLAVVVSGLVYWGLGAVWYAALFSKAYQASLNWSDAEKTAAKKNFPKALVVNLLTGLIAAYVLAQVVVLAGAGSAFDGMVWGGVVWIGFALTILLNGIMFDRMPRGVGLIHMGFYLAAYVVLGGILAVWR